MAHLIPRWRTGPWEIEAARLVLLDRRALRQDRVEFAVVTENDPTFSSNLGKPFVVGRVL